MIFTYRSQRHCTGTNRQPCPMATGMPMAMLHARLATDSHTVIRNPSTMRTRYWPTKSKFSAIPAADSDAATTATTATHTSR